MVTLADSPTDTKHRSRLRTIFFRFTLTFAVLLITYLGVWAGTAALLTQQANAWIKSQRQNGMYIQHGEPIYSGFPSRVVITYPAASIASGVFPTGWAWSTQTISIAARPLLLNQLFFNLTGTHSLTLPGTPTPTLNFASTYANFELGMDSGGAISAGRLSVSELTAAWSGSDTSTIVLDQGNFSIVSHKATNTWGIETTLHGLRVPGIFSTHVDPVIERVNFATETRLPPSHQSWQNSLWAWMDNGGMIEVHKLEIVWPPISVTAAGSMALDEELQPSGTFSANIQGFFETLDILRAEGIVRSQDSAMAKIVLGLLTRPPPNGGPPELSVSMTINDQKLYAGPVMIMKLPLVTWPNAPVQ